jgi:uncharacterized glyoxalase superfamily protein PhnB
MGNRPHDPMSIAFTVKDMKKTIDFYTKTLGFDLEASWPDDKNPMWANLMLGTQSIMIGPQMKAADVTKMCGGDPPRAKLMGTLAEEAEKSKLGAGTCVYLSVPDIDKFHATVTKKGLKTDCQPQNQFYGIRDFPVRDPDGYCLIFYTTIKMDNCQSCAMPMKDAKPGAMFCEYCTDSKGQLKPFETVLEGTTTGYFMAMQKMPRDKAEAAAREHLAKMPAWKHKK